MLMALLLHKVNAIIYYVIPNNNYDNQFDHPSNSHTLRHHLGNTFKSLIFSQDTTKHLKGDFVSQNVNYNISCSSLSIGIAVINVKDLSLNNFKFLQRHRSFIK